MGTQYRITSNGVEHSTLTYTSKARAIKEGEFIAQAAESRAAGDVITVQTVKTGKIVWSYTAPDSSVTIQGEHTEAPDAFAHMAEQLADNGGCDGFCAIGSGCDHCDAQFGPYADESESLALVRAVQSGAIPTAAVIQDRPGNVGVTHYHAAACADVQREMKRWGQSASDVIRFPFSSVAEIITHEFYDVENGDWEMMVEHAKEALVIMPCLSRLPQGDAPEEADGPMTGQYDDYNYAADNGGFTETLVTKEYHLSVVVDGGAVIDLGWVTLTMNTAQCNDDGHIADAYGKAHGTGTPRHGWGSIITVLEVCDA